MNNLTVSEEHTTFFILLYEVLMPNISLLLGLEPFKKFSVGGGGWWVVVDTTVNIVFCFGPRLGLKTEV